MSLHESLPTPSPEANPTPNSPTSSERVLRGPIARSLGKFALSAGRAYERHLDRQLDGLEAESEQLFAKLEEQGRAARTPVDYAHRTPTENREMRKNSVRDYRRGKHNTIIAGHQRTFEIIEDKESLESREAAHLEEQQRLQGRELRFDDRHDMYLRQALEVVLRELDLPKNSSNTVERKKLEAKRRSLEAQLEGKIPHLKPTRVALGTPEHDEALSSSHLHKHQRGLRKAKRSVRWHQRRVNKQTERSTNFHSIMQNGGLVAVNADVRFQQNDDKADSKIASADKLTAKLDKLERELESSKSTREDRQDARHERVMQTRWGRGINSVNDKALAFENKLKTKDGRKQLGAAAIRGIQKAKVKLKSSKKKKS